MTRRRVVRPTGLLAEHAAMETERDDALLRAERAEIERDVAVAQLEELRHLRDRWLAATSGRDIDELVTAEARAYHDDECKYQAELAELRKYVAAEREFGTKMIRHTEKLQDERDDLTRRLNDALAIRVRVEVERDSAVAAERERIATAIEAAKTGHEYDDDIRDDDARIARAGGHR